MKPTKEELIEALKIARKKFGKDDKRVYKCIYRIVKNYPYYEGYEEQWLRNNEHFLQL
ncbi:MAG: hypothetical protein ACRCX2_09680 [Paraclostridium sp.]